MTNSDANPLNPSSERVGGAGKNPQNLSADIDEKLAASIDQVFGTNSGKALRYHSWLANQATIRGLIGPRETPRLWDRHILNSAAVGEAIHDGSTVADIGSGAGLPGIPLALARPDIHVTLVEPLLRRTTFLEEVVEDLALENVTVLRGRAEDKQVKETLGQVDVVTSRAVAPLGKLSKWSLPLVRSGGSMVALKGASASEEIERDAQDIRKAKGIKPRMHQVGATILETPTYVVIIDKR